MSPINEHSTVLLAEKKGFYSVVVSDSVCSKEASYQLVLPKFTPQINPSGAISFCHDQLTIITAESVPDAQYTWFRYVDGIPETLSESTGSFSKVINESGIFKLRIESHECVFESKEIRATKIPADSIFVPNVITPNGDQWNEQFEVYTEGIADFSIRIFSRHGQEIWSGRKGSAPWNAANASSGVYFWTLSYRSHCSNNKEQKGWIQVLK
jgi:gliding motility-associated-like protein